MGTWNPVIINFKHMWNIITDAWRTERLIDKLRIWFMPTGWRPEDVKEKYPLLLVSDPDNQNKYMTQNLSALIAWSWTQLVITNIFMFHFFIISSDFSSNINFLYAGMIIIHIFSYTSTLDQRYSAVVAESVKLMIGFTLFYIQNYSWFGFNNVFSGGVVFYFISSFLLTVYFRNDLKRNAPRPNPA